MIKIVMYVSTAISILKAFLQIYIEQGVYANAVFLS